MSVPIFPSYVFLRISDLEYDLVLQDPGVLNFVFWLGQPASIRDVEMEGLQAFLGNHQDSVISLISFKTGDEVEIKAGPLRGQSGTISEIRNSRASLIIKSMGLLVRVELNSGQLERSDK